MFVTVKEIKNVSYNICRYVYYLTSYTTSQLRSNGSSIITVKWKVIHSSQMDMFYILQKYDLTSEIFMGTTLVLWRIDPLLGKDLKTNNEYNHCYATGK
jgi:hypothetical protein